MDVEQHEAFLAELVTSNGGCKLPCWWGITSGKDNIEQVSGILKNIGIRVFNNTIPQSREASYYLGNVHLHSQGIYNSVKLTVDNENVVRSITISSDGHYDLQQFQLLWANYSPYELMQQYGIPSRVRIEVIHSPASDAIKLPYVMWMFFDDLGIMVIYRGVTIVAPEFKFCPVFGEHGDLTGYLELYLQAPENKNPLEWLSGRHGAGSGSTRMYLQDATDLELEDFYRLFKNDETLETCITSDINWQE